MSVFRSAMSPYKSTRTALSKVWFRDDENSNACFARINLASTSAGMILLCPTTPNQSLPVTTNTTSNGHKLHAPRLCPSKFVSSCLKEHPDALPLWLDPSSLSCSVMPNSKRSVSCPKAQCFPALVTLHGYWGDPVTPHHITSHHMTSYHITSHHITTHITLRKLSKMLRTATKPRCGDKLTLALLCHIRLPKNKTLHRV